METFLLLPDSDLLDPKFSFAYEYLVDMLEFNVSELNKGFNSPEMLFAFSDEDRRQIIGDKFEQFVQSLVTSAYSDSQLGQAINQSIKLKISLQRKNKTADLICRVVQWIVVGLLILAGYQELTILTLVVSAIGILIVFSPIQNAINLWHYKKCQNLEICRDIIKTALDRRAAN